LFGWYDFSFGTPDQELEQAWMDFHRCLWPSRWGVVDVTSHFLKMNSYRRSSELETIISFSHFLPRMDVMPEHDGARRFLPVLGTAGLERQVRELGSAIHIYGHSHINRRMLLDGTYYLNNAFGYPYETHISKKTLYCAYESS
jgi:hypothetical protein